MSLNASIFVAYSRRNFYLIVAAIAFAVVVAAACVVNIATRQDARSAEQTRHFISVMLDERRKSLNRTLLDYADWGEAYKRLHLDTDKDWAFEQNNLGHSILTDLGVEYVAVIRPSGEVTYSLKDGELADNSVSALTGGLKDLIARARKLAPRDVSNAVLSIDGHPVLAAAAVISTGDDQSVAKTGGKPSVLLFGDRLGPVALKELGNLLHLDVVDLYQAKPNTFDAFMKTTDGSSAFNLKVTSPTPGSDMLNALLPWLLIVSTALMLSLAMLVRQGRDVAQVAAEANAALAASYVSLEQQANIDEVTGLPNRAMFMRRLSEALARRSQAAYVMFLDLDKFKPVNDRLGHAAGDAALKEVGARLRACLTGSDLVARLGGDEFVILTQDRSTAQLDEMCRSIIKTISTRMVYAGVPFTLGVSIGMTKIQPHQDTIETILRRADAALYDAKEAGRMTYRFKAADSIQAVA